MPKFVSSNFTLHFYCFFIFLEKSWWPGDLRGKNKLFYFTLFFICAIVLFFNCVVNLFFIYFMLTYFLYIYFIICLTLFVWLSLLILFHFFRSNHLEQLLEKVKSTFGIDLIDIRHVQKYLHSIQFADTIIIDKNCFNLLW